MTLRSLTPLLASLCVLACIASGCVDHAYDFDRTDKNVMLGGDDLTVPLGTTRPLQVGDLVSKRFGNLFVREDDGTFTAHYTADPVDFIFAGLKDYDGARPFRKYCNFPISTSFHLYILLNFYILLLSGREQRT